jgi:hypothetical protein
LAVNCSMTGGHMNQDFFVMLSSGG